MKRILTLLSFAMFLGTMDAQVPRTLLVEHFTQASCGPCATLNPAFFALMAQNKDEVAVIAHHTSWPGFDPMNSHNPGDAANRVSYYGVRGVPNTVVNGVGPMSTSAVNQNLLNNALAVMSPFSMDLEVTPTTTFGGIDVSLDIKAEMNVANTGNLIARVFVLEEVVTFNSPPGSNGERVFHDVMKAALPNQNGNNIADEWTNGTTENIQLDWEFENVYDFQEISVVAYIQNNNTKEVLQAVVWKPNFQPISGNDVLVSDANVSGTFGVDFHCGGSAEPIISVMNSGSERLTSFDVEYSVNGSAKSVYTWNGALNTFTSTNVVLPTITFPISELGEVNVKVLNPNGQADQAPDNSETSREFLLSANTTAKSEFRIKPLTRPSGLSFDIKDSQGNIVASGGPFSSTQEITYELDLDENECYDIRVNNTSTNLNGTFRLYNDKGDRVMTGVVSEQGDNTADFGTFNAVGTKDINDLEDWNINPNPAINEVNVELNLTKASELQIEIIDLLGKSHHVVRNYFPVGNSTQSIDLSNLNGGIYFVVVRQNDRTVSKKLLKQ